MLDLVVSRDPDIVSDAQVLGNFETSDHKLLGFNLNIDKEEKVNSTTRYDYKRMDILWEQERN